MMMLVSRRKMLSALNCLTSLYDLDLLRALEKSLGLS